MSMGIVSDTDFESETNKLKSVPVIKPEIIDINPRGRGNGNVNVPDSLRKVIGETSVIDGRQEALELGRTFGISSPSVSAYANGATSTASYHETPNKPHINSAKERIAKSARQKLRAAISALTSDKLADTKAVDLSTIAKNMAGVVKAMEPDTTNNPNGNTPSNLPPIVIYAPTFRREESFEVVYAKE